MACFHVGFNSRARKGRDKYCGRVAVSVYVSIHAPARGATAEETEDNAMLGVSIHAPARGATRFYGANF